MSRLKVIMNKKSEIEQEKKEVIEKLTNKLF